MTDDAVPRTSAWAGTWTRGWSRTTRRGAAIDERALFELLCLEGARRRGCRGTTILNRRDGYRAAYEGFDAHASPPTTTPSPAELLLDTLTIRNRASVHAFRENARAVLALRIDAGSSSRGCGRSSTAGLYRQPLARPGDIPASTPLSVPCPARSASAVSGSSGRRRLRLPPVRRPRQRSGHVDCFRHPDNVMPPPD
ncbi:MAG: DNA-3-methyladenine glycosylase I [Chloroflexota bacterium]